jgi:threonine dehydratase
MKFFAEYMKILVEPTGCLALAGAMHSGVDIKGKKVGVIIGGGNIDLQRFTELIEKR